MFRFRKVASVLASALMVGSTVGFAAATTYPAPFVDGGADAVIIYGSNPAANADLAAATSIQTDLLTRLGVSTTTDTGSDNSGSTDTGSDTGSDSGDETPSFDPNDPGVLKFERPSDLFNLGETLQDMQPGKITDEDLPELLSDGTYTADDGDDFDYEQDIDLADGLTLTVFTDSEYNNDDPSIGIRIQDGSPVLNYTLRFNDEAESDVDSNGHLEDFESSDIEIMGQSYTIVKALNGSNIELDLVTGAVKDWLNKGDSRTYTVDGNTYEVTVDYVNTDEASFTVNGESTDTMSVGETRQVGGTTISLIETQYQDKTGGSERVRFVIGADKLVLTDGQEVEVTHGGSTDTIDGLSAYINSQSTSNGAVRISSIVIEWIASNDLFIAPGDMDEENMPKMPGFANLVFTMTDFVTPAQEEIRLDPSGDLKMDMDVPIKDGTASFTLLSGNGTAFTRLGEDGDPLRTTNESTLVNVKDDESFFASWNDGNDAETYYLKISSINSQGVDIKNQLTGEVDEDNVAGSTATFGDVVLTVEGFDESAGTANISINSNGYFDRIYTKEGLEIWLPVNTTGSLPNAINLNGTANPSSWLMWFVEEDEDDNIGSGAAGATLEAGDLHGTQDSSRIFNVTIKWDTTNTEVETSVSTSSADFAGGKFDDLASDSDTNVGWIESPLATYIMHDTGPDQPTTTIEYHGAESYANVYLTASSVASGSATSTGGGTTTTDVPIIQDSETADYEDVNWIVVGGSCVNSVAADLLGVAYPTCGSDWTDATGVGATEYLIQTFDRGNGKVATLVAGYEAQDTVAAANAFTTQNLDTTAGTKYIGSEATGPVLQGGSDAGDDTGDGA